ncbi:hypothetical protein GOEFS_105_00900 [Gordonia effusa NBRC 100432]|uniref:Lipoprotein n=1 Tax=Gordonia effusa NBRC 100432 TaxID=1077974 RepID=H0R4S8_9ACTN|nr:hypothetical protein [Gordonia effusa]GAB20079.1 hypothetical protein GOEFS_105_00900 [Gordonia effusa NBRC 100432]
MVKRMRSIKRIASVVVVPIALAGALSGCGDLMEPDVSPKDVDATEARNALGGEDLKLPDDYVFIAGVAFPPGFSGHTGYQLKFEAPGEVFDNPRELADTYVGDVYGHEFGVFRPIACTAGLLAAARQKQWVTCTAATRAKYSTNDADNPDSTDVGYGSEAIVLVADAGKTQVHVVIGGT